MLLSNCRVVVRPKRALLVFYKFFVVINECSSVTFQEDEVQTVFAYFFLAVSHFFFLEDLADSHADIEGDNLEGEILFIFFHFLISISIFFFVFNIDLLLDCVFERKLFFINFEFNFLSFQGLDKEFENLDWITDLIWISSRAEDLCEREDGPFVIIVNNQLFPIFP